MACVPELLRHTADRGQTFLELSRGNVAARAILRSRPRRLRCSECVGGRVDRCGRGRGRCRPRAGRRRPRSPCRHWSRQRHFRLAPATPRTAALRQRLGWRARRPILRVVPAPPPGLHQSSAEGPSEVGLRRVPPSGRLAGQPREHAALRSPALRSPAIPAVVRLWNARTLSRGPHSCRERTPVRWQHLQQLLEDEFVADRNVVVAAVRYLRLQGCA